MTSDPAYFLLVDDRKENLLSLKGVLRRDGLILLEATSGQEALELLLKHEIALAIVDVQMPGMDGYELAELMHGNERTGRVPIIFLTAGMADRQRSFRGYEAGAVDFLQKPIEPDVLRSKAQVFLELYLQRRQLARQRDELKAYADALQEADRRKDEFLAVLAHELRNPLTPIRYGLDMMRQSADGRLSADLRTMMDRQLTHLVRIIDDLLDVSRISRGKIDLRREPVILQTIIEAAVQASRPLVESGELSLSVELAGESLHLLADSTRIAQVVSNLLNNAAKYTPRGGKISIRAAKEDNKAVIVVSDNGVGIPPHMLGKVFDLFMQVEGGIKRSQGGLGIGLALARQLVEMHQGSITMESPGEGLGTTCTIRLPLHAPAAEVLPEETPLPVGSVSLRILVVDDNISAAEATGKILSLLGHEVSLSHDGPSALQTARALKPDAIVLDIGMPGMSGYEVCRRLREDPALARTVLIAQTGWGDEKDREQARQAGFHHHLTKPVSVHELAGLLAKSPAGSEAGRQPSKG